jgi:hypothetical protein
VAAAADRGAEEETGDEGARGGWSDADASRPSTGQGTQFPIVYYPFQWGRVHPSRVPVLPRPGRGDLRTVDVAGGRIPKHEHQHKVTARRDLRLAYVALTRPAPAGVCWADRGQPRLRADGCCSHATRTATWHPFGASTTTRPLGRFDELNSSAGCISVKPRAVAAPLGGSGVAIVG